MTYYLNNNGSRWREISESGESDRVAIRIDGVIVASVAVDAYEAFGNFASTMFRYRGRRFNRLADDWTYSPDGLAIIDLSDAYGWSVAST